MRADNLLSNGFPAARPLSKIAEYLLRTTSIFFVRLRQMLAPTRPILHSKPAWRVPTGRVTLVGAGPGDPELLTVKALRVLERADVVLFDSLVSDSILELANADAEFVCVGKRGGRPSCRQDDINGLMLTYARAGKHVVRLKAGDPSIFGRAGEEIACLESQGIDACIVPGITAASAMAAAFGVSLTHRNHAKSVRFVTGHSKNGGLPEDLDWEAIADPSATTIFYMGGPFAGEIAERLITLGMPRETPVGIAASLSRTNQQIARCTLIGLEDAIAAFDRSDPLLLGIGAVYLRASATPLVHTDECNAG
jgi:uroporphyrin-III C-methyltransferase/precorrin-2 dehydrogenase/sirohydrochlorin ferrochelatase